VHPVIFTPGARAELIEAHDWYEREVTGLGRRFRQAIDVMVQRMNQNPRQFPVVFKNVRRARRDAQHPLGTSERQARYDHIKPKRLEVA
jgi:hypothetical protein